MASVQDLKKNVNYVLGDIIEAVYIWELTNPDKETKKSQAIVDDAILVFDELIEKINKKDVDNRKKHFKSVSAELENKGRALIDKINNL
ncbi:MAG: hypothetical protein CVU03_08995 [Bacteroidetes bacterium HGW-Bacteroidetes-2]|jgi:hypothetical protein|nr:MAG: hypothetical protein CVU03_08995 [Bacteroidetes bacterium HGW-Bacteroidetes-2]